MLFPTDFSAVDLYGNPVTPQTLGEKEVFLIYYWATWCGACVQGLPDLVSLAENYGDRVGFIGLLDDYSSNLSGAVNIMNSVGMPDNFVMIDARLNSVRPMLQMVSTGYVPSTAFLYDGGTDGPHIGALGNEYARIIDRLLG
jgi:thiol-disulfide isomerase/thioredoxin